LFIAHHNLTNVTWLIDRNRIQGIGKTEDVMRLEPLGDKLRSFGFHVASADGHDFGSLAAARAGVDESIGKKNMPGVVICSTIKGHGVSYMENTVDCHYLPMKEDQYATAIAELDAAQAEFRGGTRG
jgi:transketolase